VSLDIGPKTQAIQFSLRARDPEEAKARYAVALERYFSFLKSLRKTPARLAQKQVVALSGEVYRELVTTFENDPGPEDRWEYLAGLLNHVPGMISASPENRTALVDRILSRNDINLDPETAARLTPEVRRGLIEDDYGAREKAKRAEHLTREINIISDTLGQGAE